LSEGEAVTIGETARPYALSREEGEALWLLGSLSTIKATAESTGGALTLMEIHGPRGMQVPLHTHAEEQEAWYLIDGEVTFQVEDRTVDASAGAFVFVPSGVPHGFRVESETARFLDIRTPSGFEGFFRAVGDPAQSHELPPAGPPDLDRLVEAAPRFGMQIVGPPPAQRK
jgi:quercetin dioxygenase-like cupin family protein